jgi:hypothetical protein
LFNHEYLNKVPGYVGTPGEEPVCRIVARYVEATSPTFNSAVFHLTSEEVTVLNAFGYGLQDVKLWSLSLLSRQSHDAAAMLFAKEQPAPPYFVLVLLLHRGAVGHRALQILLRHLRDKIYYEPIRYTGLKYILALFICHANRNWPESLPFVAELVTAGLAKLFKQSKEGGRVSTRYASRLTSLSNDFLFQFAGNISQNPVVSAVYQEKAQFKILRFMANQSPALIVTRDGFRALARVQAAHRKTSEEAEWARLKSPSWPPWKTNRTAMDESKEIEHGLSRASQVITRMHEAGYVSRTWEDILGIYAGRDTDGSPTIQHRTALSFLPFHKPKHLLISSYEWAARIRATRTRREAWACFLSFEASGIPPTSHIYLAIFEKIARQEVKLEAGVLQRSAQSPLHTVLLPGDAMEVWPEPSSSHDAVYISEPLPTYENLWERMMKRGDVRMDDRLLVFLFDTAPKFSLVIDILESPCHDFISLRSLLDAPVSSKPIKWPIPQVLFAAFIRCLFRFGRFQGSPEAIVFDSSATASHKAMLESDPTYRMHYSFSILSQYRPQYRPAWTAWMRGIAYRARKSRTQFSRVEAWKILRRLFRQMQEVDVQPDSEQFQLLCQAAEYAWRWSVGPGKGCKEGRWMTSRRDQWARDLRLEFHAFVRPHADLPTSSVQVPDPAALHAYARVLGELHDYEGLYSFSSWMAAHHQEITTKANARHTGLNRIRRTLCALRVGLARGSGLSREGKAGASEDIVELVKAQVNQVQAWGGWPTANEVSAYKRLSWSELENI